MQGYSLESIIVEELFTQNDSTLSVLRLDKIHPIVSGNKLFKLHYFLQDAILSDHKTILSFGGAYSNHLVAAAFAAKEAGLRSIGIVRGEEPATLSHTLQNCIDYGMQLKFISREDYALKDDDNFIAALKNEFGECMIIPEGGYHPLGAKGAALIMDLAKQENYSHICIACGTATTLAGLLQNAGEGQEIISVPVLKGMDDTIQRLHFLTENKFDPAQLNLFTDYHFGGYAKKTSELISFMNQLWEQYQLPADFVYTAKLFYAVFDKIKLGYFKPGSNILCIHTGGLQGNLSLPPGTLNF